MGPMSLLDMTIRISPTSTQLSLILYDIPVYAAGWVGSALFPKKGQPNLKTDLSNLKTDLSNLNFTFKRVPFVLG